MSRGPYIYICILETFQVSPSVCRWARTPLDWWSSADARGGTTTRCQPHTPNISRRLNSDRKFVTFAVVTLLYPCGIACRRAYVLSSRPPRGHRRMHGRAQPQGTHSAKVYGGTSLIRNSTPRKVVLYGPMRARFRMSEVSLYPVGPDASRLVVTGGCTGGHNHKV